jgi:CelD/BcsL family acetyltransferase involved in cellulose biosynthesis
MYRLIKHTDIRTIKDAWNTLYNHNIQLTPYQEYSYCSIIDEYSVILKRHRLKNVIYELRNTHNQTIMVVPLHIETIKKQSVAHLWGEFSQSGHLDFIYDEQIQTEAFLSAMNLINRDIGNVKFVLTGIAEQSKLNEMIQTVFPPSHYTCRKNTCVQIPITTSFKNYLNSLNKQVRQNLRSSMNRLKTNSSTYEVKTYVNQTIPSDICLQLFKIYWNRLSDKELTIGIKRFLPVFLRMQLNPTIIALKKLTNVFYSIIYIDKTIAGFCAGFTARNGKIILPFLAINSTFSRFSPGGLLITESIKFLIENHNYKYFDLSRGDEKYKYAYGGIEHFNFSYEIYPEGIK